MLVLYFLIKFDVVSESKSRWFSLKKGYLFEDNAFKSKTRLCNYAQLRENFAVLQRLQHTS